MSKVVEYKGKIYLWYKTNSAGFAQLINENGIKFTGTPLPDKLTVLKEVPTIDFNGNKYAITKKGIFSCTTGERIVHPEILSRANKLVQELQQHERYYCVVCHKNIVDVDNGFDTCPECANKI